MSKSIISPLIAQWFDEYHRLAYWLARRWTKRLLDYRSRGHFTNLHIRVIIGLGSFLGKFLLWSPPPANFPLHGVYLHGPSARLAWISFRGRPRRARQHRSALLNGCEQLESRHLLAANPVLSEFVALNRTSLQDEDGQFSDWLEIQNRGDSPAALGGYYLSNDSANLTAWQMPPRSLAPGESLVVFASAKDRKTETLHTNFTLDETGGFLALVRPNGTTIVTQFSDYPALGEDQAYGSYRPSGQFEFITGDDVRALVPQDAQLGGSWTGGSEPFDDSAAAGWLHGAGPVGYDRTNGKLNIALDLEMAMYGKNGSAYLRYPFRVDQPEDLQTLSLKLNFDDGYVLYLNGHEIARRNAPTVPTYNSTAPNELGVIRSELDLTRFREYLRPGQNMLAIQGLNWRADDGEFFIDAQLNGRGLLPEEVGVLDVPTPGGTNGLVEPVITEFMAANRSSLDDEDGESSDWIEVAQSGPDRCQSGGLVSDRRCRRFDRLEISANLLGSR